jgi:hypothetical protein
MISCQCVRPIPNKMWSKWHIFTNIGMDITTLETIHTLFPIINDANTATAWISDVGAILTQRNVRH